MSMRVRVSLGFAAAAVCVSGCSSARSDSDTATAAPDAGAVAGAGASGDGPVSSNDVQPCKRLALSDVAPLYGVPLKMSHDDDLIGTASGCFFRSDGDKDNLEVVTVVGPMAQHWWSDNQKSTPTVPFPGLGDRAVRIAGDVSVLAVKGDEFCMVRTAGPAYRKHLVGLESYDEKPIPDAAAVAEATKLGALCAKLFN